MRGFSSRWQRHKHGETGANVTPGTDDESAAFCREQRRGGTPTATSALDACPPAPAPPCAAPCGPCSLASPAATTSRIPETYRFSNARGPPTACNALEDVFAQGGLF